MRPLWTELLIANATYHLPTNSHHSIILETGIFLSHLIWMFRTRKIRKEAATREKTFDDIAAEHEERGLPFKFAERKSSKQRKDAEAGEGGQEQDPSRDIGTQ